MSPITPGQSPQSHERESHPKKSELFELHFGELSPERRQAVAVHLRSCDPCRAFVADLSSIEDALALAPEDAPPADGLDRVLARIGQTPPVPERRDHRLRSILPSLVAIAGGVTMIHQGGVVGALAFFLGGALLTLAIAPVLILESQRRAS